MEIDLLTTFIGPNKDKDDNFKLTLFDDRNIDATTDYNFENKDEESNTDKDMLEGVRKTCSLAAVEAEVSS